MSTSTEEDLVSASNSPSPCWDTPEPDLSIDDDIEDRPFKKPRLMTKHYSLFETSRSPTSLATESESPKSPHHQFQASGYRSSVGPLLTRVNLLVKQAWNATDARIQYLEQKGTRQNKMMDAARVANKRAFQQQKEAFAAKEKEFEQQKDEYEKKLADLKMDVQKLRDGREEDNETTRKQLQTKDEEIARLKTALQTDKAVDVESLQAGIKAELNRAKGTIDRHEQLKAIQSQEIKELKGQLQRTISACKGFLKCWDLDAFQLYPDWIDKMKKVTKSIESPTSSAGGGEMKAGEARLEEVRKEGSPKEDVRVKLKETGRAAGTSSVCVGEHDRREKRGAELFV